MSRAGCFDYFVILAEMRTGSNLLEATLGQMKGLHCHGEAFNPAFIGGPARKKVLGVTMAERQADPQLLLGKVREADGLNGFRFFHDHDPRVLDAILDDPRCAKIVLTRNPVECYVSHQIARHTNRWRMTDVKDKATARPRFDAEEFDEYLAARQAFQVRVLNALQISGQTAFYLDYEDSLRIDVINGLLAFLGFDAEVAQVSDTLVRQNPEALSDKVENFDEMEAALRRVDWAGLSRTPCFEPRRGPGIPRYIAAAGAPLLYMPIHPGPDRGVRAWLAGLGDGGLEEDFTQKSLRAWKRKAKGHRSFAVLRHPVERANEVFSAVLMRDGFAEMRQVLRARFEVAIPTDGAVAGMTVAEYRDALLAFMGFVAINLSGQTPFRQDQIWASQWSILSGFAQFASPDMLCRYDTLTGDLGHLARLVGVRDCPMDVTPESEALFPMAAIHDEALEHATRNAWRRDYMTYGFGDWTPSA